LRNGKSEWIEEKGLTLREKDSWGRERGRSAEGGKGEEDEVERGKSLLPPPRPPPGLKLRTI